MRLRAEWVDYTLNFLFEARTSRESMTHKATWLVKLTDLESGQSGVGECALFRGLSSDDFPDYENRLRNACLAIENSTNPADTIRTFKESSITFGFETALQNLSCLELNGFTSGVEGIPINGLIWMGDKPTMRQRIDEKLNRGYKVLKLKIGGIDFESELDLLRYIRSVYSTENLEIRLDANGSFTAENAMQRLSALSKYGIHSIEQPVMARQWETMSKLCNESPIPIALDEELIGKIDDESKAELLDSITPQYIILKPALCGGFHEADHWIDLAEQRGIGWWATSALESNVGLEAIARWCYGHKVTMPQGLGTGQLYSNNFPSPLELRGDRLFHLAGETISVPELPWRQ